MENKTKVTLIIEETSSDRIGSVMSRREKTFKSLRAAQTLITKLLKRAAHHRTI